MTVALKIENLSKTFAIKGGLFSKAHPGVRAVHPTTLEVQTGETLGIVGESGCGKSTFARMLVGLLDPTTGVIEIEGKPFDNANPAEFGKMIQYMFQDPVSSLNPRKTIRQIMEAPLKLLYKMPKAEREKRIAAIFDSVNLRHEFWIATRTNSQVGRRSGSGSPGRWRLVRGSLFWTKLCLRLMCPCRRRC